MTSAAVASAVPERKREWNPYLIIVPALLLSVGLHVGTVTGLSHARPQRVEQKPIEMLMITVEPPKPPPPPPEPEPLKPKVKPPPSKVAEIKPIPKEPPPPIEEAPKEPPKPVPLVVGILMSSTTGAGAFAAPVGNTAYGKTDDKAVNPSDVQAYRAPKYVPPGGADTDPVVEGEVKVPYPDEARKAGIEGTVQLRLRIEADGHVSEVKILRGPGYGLEEAAREALKRFKFKPATKAGELVATTITYLYTFEID